MPPMQEGPRKTILQQMADLSSVSWRPASDAACSYLPDSDCEAGGGGRCAAGADPEFESSRASRSSRSGRSSRCSSRTSRSGRSSLRSSSRSGMSTDASTKSSRTSRRRRSRKSRKSSRKSRKSSRTSRMSRRTSNLSLPQINAAIVKQQKVVEKVRCEAIKQKVAELYVIYKKQCVFAQATRLEITMQALTYTGAMMNFALMLACGGASAYYAIKDVAPVGYDLLICMAFQALGLPTLMITCGMPAVGRFICTTYFLLLTALHSYLSYMIKFKNNAQPIGSLFGVLDYQTQATAMEEQARMWIVVILAVVNFLIAVVCLAVAASFTGSISDISRTDEGYAELQEGERRMLVKSKYRKLRAAYKKEQKVLKKLMQLRYRAMSAAKRDARSARSSRSQRRSTKSTRSTKSSSRRPLYTSRSKIAPVAPAKPTTLAAASPLTKSAACHSCEHSQRAAAPVSAAAPIAPVININVHAAAPAAPANHGHPVYVDTYAAPTIPDAPIFPPAPHEIKSAVKMPALQSQIKMLSEMDKSHYVQ